MIIYKKKDIIKYLRLKSGLTLVELLIVMSILMFMVGIVVGGLNPIALVNKARDSRRKNDLNKIKIAFEAYYTDKGNYPTKAEIDNWNVVANCGKVIPQMKSYLKTLPCDPKGNPYEIILIYTYIDTENNDTISKAYKVLANLENKKDNDIPSDWYTSDLYNYRDRVNEVNYGVSSSNILWYDYSGIDPTCGRDCMSATILGSECGSTNNCVSGGATLCFIGKCSGNNLGAVLPGFEDKKTPQCYVSRCCQGSGCE